MSNSLRTYGLQHARLPCPSPTPGACSNTSIELVMPSNYLILCHPLLLLPSIFSSIRIFSKESILDISWPKYWRFNFSIGPSNEYSGLISFRMTGWVSLQSKALSTDLSKTRVQNHQFFIAHHSLWCNCHIHTWQLEKIIALIILNFFSKVMSILLKKIYRFVIVFLQMSKHLLISWL